jgi:hypothetical protein
MPAESEGIVTLTQDGCNVCLPAVLGVSICGPVTNDHLQLSGPFVKCVNGRELENHFNLAGPASLSEFHLTGSGIARCEVQGYVATCTATASMDGGFALGCVGDCDSMGTVTVDEILTMVNIALANADIETCLAGDQDNSGTITVDEILTAVNHALTGCAG